ncbi:hypothetical protein Mesau_04538 [Mesorhizobium australicum WSM2073]|uniref:Uncharacterized protein n=1 Tax=Mesorhizobium australicum (strain HAMBI 3006 / LMG 24608 / WSM2073) TaxID=754035 RepID=L0KQC1_MESAW|nr:hypothetical protein Mesau_04538 [Mesorhizobium australicum WSM2073]
MHVAPKCPRLRDNDMHKIRSLRQVGRILFAATRCKPLYALTTWRPPESGAAIIA